MKPLFADTSYSVALLSHTDEKHQLALDWSERFLGRLVTTEHIFVELGSAFARSTIRPQVVRFIRHTMADPATLFIPATNSLFSHGLELYADRADKGWSLVDCISFVVMKERSITDALTTDRHFEQAGFKALLR